MSVASLESLFIFLGKKKKKIPLLRKKDPPLILLPGFGFRSESWDIRLADTEKITPPKFDMGGPREDEEKKKMDEGKSPIPVIPIFLLPPHRTPLSFAQPFEK